MPCNVSLSISGKVLVSSVIRSMGSKLMTRLSSDHKDEIFAILSTPTKFI